MVKEKLYLDNGEFIEQDMDELILVKDCDASEDGYTEMYDSFSGEYYLMKGIHIINVVGFHKKKGN